MGVTSIPAITGPSNHGTGVFATRAIAVGEIIFFMAGDVVSGDELEVLGYTRGYPLQVGEDTFVRLAYVPEMVNHACDPNAGIRADRMLVAIRDIAAGEKITYDYATTMAEGEDGWTLACRCGSPRCRGTVGDFDTMPAAEQRRYLELGVVLGHVLSARATRPRGRSA